MKNFKLHDQTNKFAHCVAFGRHVGNPFISNCNAVVLYFAKYLTGVSGCSGQLWMYDESHIVLLGTRFSVPPARILMDLR